MHDIILYTKLATLPENLKTEVVDKAKRKNVMCYCVNIPLTYLSIVLFGWATYYLVGSNPTFIFPFVTLMLVFYLVYLGISIGILQWLKIYKTEIYLWVFAESAIVYLIIWYLA